MIYLRQSTASQEVPLGHFVSDADGKTASTALTIANTDIKVWKSGAIALADKTAGGATHISGGIYYCVLDATDTDTIGPLVLFVAVTGALAVRLECCVLDEAMYDWQFGTSPPLAPTVAGRTLDVSAGGEAGVDWANVGSPTTAVTLSNTTISTTQSITSVSGAVGSVTGNVGGNVIGSVASVVGNVGGSVLGNVAGSVGSVTAVVSANVTQYGGTAGTFAAGRPEVNVTHWRGTAVAIPTVAGVPEVDATHLDGAVYSGTALGVMAGEYGADVFRVAVLANNTITAASIAADAVTEIQAGLATGANLAAVKAKTDSLTFTVAGRIDANIKSVNDVAVTGTGAVGNEWGP